MLRGSLVPRTFRFAILALSIIAAILTQQPAGADDLAYTKLDEATVRVFSYDGVTAQRTHGASRRAYVVGVPEGGHGTGLLVSSNGLILTARHVIKDAHLIAVQFPEEDHPIPARVVYSDPNNDHAYLAVGGTHAGFVPIPDHKPKLAVRQTVYVIGYPLDASRKHPQSQQGIVSGVLPDGSLQLGIALNPGNSGGPVVDADEHLIGIAVARADPNAGAQGIGVAVALEHILDGYRKAQKSEEFKVARAALAHEDKVAQAEADFVGALLTAEDVDAPWKALRGKKDAPAISPTLDKAVAAALQDDKRANADVLAFASAQMWNAGTVSLERHAPPGDYLKKARDYAARAKRADPDVVQRSPFVSFVLEEHEPTDVDAGLPIAKQSSEEEGDTTTEETAAADPRDVIIGSLKTESSFPVLRAGPTIGVITPFEVVGVGAVARVLLAERISLNGRYQFGMHFKDSGSSAGHVFDLTGGIAIATWKSRTTAQLVVDVENAGWATVYHYVPGEVPTSHAIIVEGGVLSGPVNLQHQGQPEFVRQVFMTQAGLRYMYFYHANSDYLARAARRSFEVSAHALFPTLNVPSNSANADGNAIRQLPGFNVDIAWDSVLSWGQTELGAGYFPAGAWIYFHLGWSYLFY